MKNLLQKKTLLILVAIILCSVVLGACIESPNDAITDEEPSNIWQWLLYGLKWLLNTLFDFTQLIGVPSYALAILLFTIIVKLVLQPLMGKQLRSTRQMAKIQPKVKEIQEKYKGNQQKIQEMQMALYKEHNVNPMAGCLPLLIQMPILIALFTTLRNFKPLYPEYHTFFWIKDLSLQDPTIILAVVVALTTFAQQYVSIVNKEDKTQKMMLYTMPIFFAIMTKMSGFPAGLALYWIFYSIVGAIIQIIFNYFYAKEEAREEALAAERSAAEEAEKKNKKNKINTKTDFLFI